MMHTEQASLYTSIALNSSNWRECIRNYSFP